MIQINMKMPKRCYDCKFCVKGPSQIYCFITDYWALESNKRPAECPLQEVKE